MIGSAFGDPEKALQTNATLTLDSDPDLTLLPAGPTLACKVSRCRALGRGGRTGRGCRLHVISGERLLRWGGVSGITKYGAQAPTDRPTNRQTNDPPIHQPTDHKAGIGDRRRARSAPRICLATATSSYHTIARTHLLRRKRRMGHSVGRTRGWAVWVHGCMDVWLCGCTALITGEAKNTLMLKKHCVWCINHHQPSFIRNVLNPGN